MSVLTLGTHKPAAAHKSIKDIFAEVFGDSSDPELNIPGISSLPKQRRNKVIMLRRQLAHGTYNVEERIDTTIERIFTDISQ